MRILIDADGCPVVDQTVAAARAQGIACLIFCDTAHVFEKPGATTRTVSQGPDSVDFALVNDLAPGDLVVTQDYGLAAMCLARRARVLNQDGEEYTDETIDSQLLSRYSAGKFRRAGGRTKGPPRRTAAQDQAFVDALRRLLDAAQSGSRRPCGQKSTCFPFDGNRRLV